MKATLKQVAKQALSLSSKDRAALASVLIRSLDPEPRESQAEVKKAWKIEIKRRIEDLRTGRVKAIPAEKVFAKLRAKYGWTR